MPRAISLLVLVLCLVGVSVVEANMAKPWDDGDVVGEPTGALSSVKIIEEDLSFDLRPLAENSPVLIEATYKLQNEGERAEVELFFVAPGLDEGTVLVNGTKVDSQQVDRELPEAWRSDSTTFYEGSGFLFKASLSEGENRIEVKYSARAAREHPSSRVHSDYVVSYILAPARQWASFGKLNVTVQSPEGWSLTTTPHIEGGEASFEGLPANNFKLLLRPPTGIRYIAHAMMPLGIILGLLLPFFVGRLSRKRFRTASWGKAILIGLCLGLVAGALGGVLSFGVTFLGDMIPDSAYRSRTWSYGNVLQGLLFSVLTAVVGVFVCLLGRGRAWQSAGEAQGEGLS